jgi:hypothetical protein
MEKVRRKTWNKRDGQIKFWKKRKKVFFLSLDFFIIE